jgi:hypothetical protein
MIARISEHTKHFTRDAIKYVASSWIYSPLFVLLLFL